MIQKLRTFENRLDELNALMSEPHIIANPSLLQKYGQEHAELSRIVRKMREYEKVEKLIRDDKALLEDDDQDQEIREMARDELEVHRKEKERLEREIRLMLLPKDPRDEKNVIIEIRAGTGGGEAALFAADLFKMYSKYAEKEGWRVEIMNSHHTGLGGFKEIIALIQGKDVYSRLKYESGTHRVQRVPETEASGRIHTSTITVAILPEVEEVEIELDPNDLRIDVFRSTGPGGQSVNTTDSAVRITHIPTGTVVTCQDEKSQHKNKAKALKVLRARLQAEKEEEEERKRSEERRMQVGTGDRSERIRTYNFPQSRVTDHRINLTLYKLESILEGDIEPLIDKLMTADQEAMMKNLDHKSLAAKS